MVATALLNVEGMTCNHCKMAVEKALKTVDGVAGAAVDLNAKTVKIDYDPGVINEGEIKKTISDAGYDVK